MRYSRGRAVIPRRQDIAIADDYRPDLGPRTGRALGDLPRDGHEVLVPAWPLHPPVLRRVKDARFGDSLTSRSGADAVREPHDASRRIPGCWDFRAASQKKSEPE